MRRAGEVTASHFDQNLKFQSIATVDLAVDSIRRNMQVIQPDHGDTKK